MKPFDPPANCNAPAESPLWGLLWLRLPMASYAAAVDVATYQMRCWAAAHQAMLDVSQTLWRASRPMDAGAAASPVLVCAAADVHAAGAAVLQAQQDAVEALRRSA